MHKLKQAILSAILIAPMAMTLACSEDSSGGGSTGSTCGGVGSSGPFSTVDVAVADDLSDTDGANSIFVYLNILGKNDSAGGGAHPTADIIVNNFGSSVGSQVNQAQAIVLTSDEGSDGGDMYVGSQNGEVLIWREYAGLSSGADADAMLDNVGGVTDINNPRDMIVDEDDNLVIADQGANAIFIYYDASALTDNGGDIANVELTNSLCTGFDYCINNPRSIAVSSDEGTATGGDLYVANGNLNSTGDPIVAIYRDIDGLTTDQDPDTALTDDESFLNLSATNGCQGQDVHVAHNVLFVSLDSADPSCAQVFVFNEADGLSTDALPDAILFGNDTYFQKPYQVDSIDVSGSPLLLVGSIKNFSSGGPSHDGPALSSFGGWFDNAGAFALVTGQAADTAVSDVPSNLNKTATLANRGGALFAVGTSDPEESEDIWDLYVFKNVGVSGVCENMVPNIIIPGSGLSSDSTNDYISLYGTFGSLNLSNAMGLATRTPVGAL